MGTEIKNEVEIKLEPEVEIIEKKSEAPEILKVYNCNKCNFTSARHSNFKRHISKDEGITIPCDKCKL